MRFLRASRIALAVLGGALSASLAAQIPTVYPASGRPNGITGGPDGNVWFTENAGGKIARITPAGVITEFPVLSQNPGLQFITTGPDGNLWFTEGAAGKIGRITPAGFVTEFPIPTQGGGPSGIVTGPDGNLWFMEQGGKVGKITTSGFVTEYDAAPPGSRPIRITAGPDGNLWFAELVGNKIGRITTSGAVTEFPLPTANSFPLGITAGPDGNIWFTERVRGLGYITTSGAITDVAAPTVSEAITTGPDGRLWFPNSFEQIGRFYPGGPITSYVASISGSIEDIAAGPDGNLWFTDLTGKVGKISPGCVPNATTLCLDSERFKLRAQWKTADGTGFGQAVKLTDDSGYFWFFSSGNIEMLVKALNGCSLSSTFWVFAGGLTNVEVTLFVTDMRTNALKTYFNPGNTPFQPIQDTSAFPTCSVPSSPPPGGQLLEGPPGEGAETEKPGPSAPAGGQLACAEDATAMCLNNGRFRVTAAWRSAQGSGQGQAVRLTGDSGYFWFFSASNAELIVKALNACSFNNRYWVFSGGLTNVEVTLTVTDTATGAVKVYVNPLNTAFQPIQDTSAFATCP
ncbi:MAG TPA: hypothetical protein VKH43_07880 [Thermoanaerobaculia bacterium]|nr:hypothetical protein [Thermoanaerobaculia bacterium]